VRRSSPTTSGFDPVFPKPRPNRRDLRPPAFPGTFSRRAFYRLIAHLPSLFRLGTHVLPGGPSLIRESFPAFDPRPPESHVRSSPKTGNIRSPTATLQLPCRISLPLRRPCCVDCSLLRHKGPQPLLRSSLFNSFFLPLVIACLLFLCNERRFNFVRQVTPRSPVPWETPPFFSWPNISFWSPDPLQKRVVQAQVTPPVFVPLFPLNRLKCPATTFRSVRLSTLSFPPSLTEAHASHRSDMPSLSETPVSLMQIQYLMFFLCDV